MKSKRLISFVLIFLLFVSILIPNAFAALPTVTTNASTGVEETNATLNGYLNDDGGGVIGLFENYVTGDDSWSTIYQQYYSGQAFTPTITHNITSVKLYLYKLGNPGTIYVNITATTNSGWPLFEIKPTGANLTWGTTNGNTLPGASPYEWREITFAHNYSLTAGTSYAITVNCHGDAANFLCWRHDSAASTYSIGNRATSNNHGSSWIASTTSDGMFEEYGYGNGSYVKFQYGTTTSYGTNTTQQFKLDGQTFLQNIIGLTPGQLYHFRATATNLSATGYGSDKTFLTKPNEPTALTATTINTTKISLTWTKGAGANNTMIRQKKGSYPTSYTDGDLLYNGTGTTASNSSLSPGTAYRYRAWSFAKWINGSTTSYQWSDTYATTYELTYPVEPANANATFGSDGMNLNLSWDKGSGTNNTMILMKTTGVPTSITDGTIIYNGTGTYTLYPFTIGTTYYFKTWSFAKWTINPTIYHFSTGGTTFTITGTGGLLINCFDENTHANLTFNVKVSNMSGSKVYQSLGATNTLVINTSLCPLGPNIQVIVSATGYQQRIYTIPYLYSTIFYLLNTYLPPETAPGNGTVNCELRPYIDSKIISNPAVDAVITFTYPLEDMISVELYNNSLYGTYGGWIFVTSDNYTFTSSQLTVEHEIMDANTTMIRVNYYYNFCTGGVESALYNLRVVETIETSYTQVDQAVENVFMTIKKYINSSGTFIPVSSIYTDANGYVNLYLVPNAHYKIFLNKSGYYNVTGADYIPIPPNAYGQTEEKWFRIVAITGGVTNLTTFSDAYDFYATMHTNNTINIICQELISATTNAQLYVYDTYNMTITLKNFTSYTGTLNINIWISGINTSRMYVAILYINHTLVGYSIQTLYIMPIGNESKINKTWLETKISEHFGNWDLGYVNTVLLFIPAICLIVLFGAAHQSGLGLFLSGCYLGGILKFVQFDLGTAAKMAMLCGLFIVMGILLIIAKRKGWYD